MGSRLSYRSGKGRRGQNLPRYGLRDMFCWEGPPAEYLFILEIREQNGYTSHDVPVYTLSSDDVEEIAVPSVCFRRLW